jgi:AcrR family transcriptional regulator
VPERGSRFQEMVAAARDLLETEGPEALTMRRVAARLGLREPSLYKHSSGRDELLAAVVASGMRDLAEGRLKAIAAAAGVPDALLRLAAHQREFAARHPHLYRLMFDRPFPRELLETPADARAWRPVVELLGSEERVWAAFAFAHGMLELERTGRLVPGDLLEAVWRVGLAAFEGVSRRPVDRPPAEPDLDACRDLVADLQAALAAFRRAREP